MTHVIAIVGPTASGKTALGIELALRLGGEVVSADSRQVYRGLNLGTGKVTADEARGVPHHLIDVADPREQFTAFDFVTLGHRAIEEIQSRGKVPIVVGGTGMYIDALLGRLQLDAPAPDQALRTRLSAMEVEELLRELKRADPARYARVDLKNRRRILRALEIALSPSLNNKPQTAHYAVTWIGLSLPQPELKERIHTRLLEHLRAGMLEEAKRLHQGGLTFERMEELGLEYRYLARHLAGVMGHEEMVERLGIEIGKYARRQMTWFKRNPAIRWFNPLEAPPLPGILEILDFVRQRSG